MLICGGVPHAGHALANELICLPHLEHGIRDIGGECNYAVVFPASNAFKPSPLMNVVGFAIAHARCTA